MPEFARNMAFVIGINNYGSGIPPLQSAVNDAKKLVEILREQHGYQVWVCLDQLATLKNLNDLFEKTLAQQVKPDDRLLFYFAGHGIALNSEDGPQGYLIPQDAKLGDTKTYLPMSLVHECLSKLPCRHFLGILDCCFAGAFRWSSTRDLLTALEVIHKERYDRFIADPAWQVITSAASDQKALDTFNLNVERGEIGNHSPFAAALFEALAGGADAYPPATNGKPPGDGVITATELYLYLRDRVELATQGNQLRQTPGIWALNKHDKGEYIFLTPGHQLNLPPAPPLDESKNPYRGLQSFEEEHSHLFFGRQALTEKLHEFVSKQPLTVVLGASGSGKSSAVKAGLIPELKKNQQQWCVLPIMRPGESPLKALNNTLVAVNVASASITSLLSEQKVETLSDSLAAWYRANPNSKLLLVIDQLEELITLCKEEQEREKFLSLLGQAVSQYPEQLRIVLTLRSDFEPQFQDTALKEYWNAARFVVAQMTRVQLREAIEEPASAKVMYFQSDNPKHPLIEQLINEVAEMPGGLPLLSFTLSELYLKYLKRQKIAQDRGETIDRAITEADYKELGGVARSLTQRADSEYEELVKQDKAYEQTICQVMLRMVAVGSGDLARRQVPLSELEYPPTQNERVKEVIGRFSAARLLVQGRDTDGKSYVEPAHDVLMRGWQKLLNWVKEEKNLRLQRRLTPAALDWKSQQQSRFLWNADPYLNVLQKEVLNSHNNNWLNQLETEFVQQSIKQKHRDTRSRWGIGIAVSLVITTFVASAATFVGTIWSNLANKSNVILFASPGQKISGITDYRYFYTPDTARAYKNVLNQIVFGIKESVPACIDVGLLLEKGERIEDRKPFNLTAPQEPGVYYIQFRSALEYFCDQDYMGKSAINKWKSGEYPIPEQSNVGIVVVGNVFNFSIYPEILSAYSQNVPSSAVVTGDENPNSGIYVSLRDFRFDKK